MNNAPVDPAGPSAGGPNRADHLALAFEHTPTPIVISTLLSGRIAEVNPAFCRLSGQSRDQLIGRTSIELGIWRSDDARTQALSSMVRQDGASSSTVFIPLPGGRRGRVSVSRSIVTLNGEDCLITWVHDILPEQSNGHDTLADGLRLDAAMASMTDGVMISDLSGSRLTYNDAYMRFHRFRNRLESENMLRDHHRYLEMRSPGGVLEAPDNLPRQRALRGETGNSIEYELYRKDLKTAWIGSYSFSPIRDADGAVIGSIISCREITDQRESQIRLRQSSQRLEHQVRQRTLQLAAATRAAQSANKAKTAFLANMSHEIRTPLNTVTHIAQLIRHLGVTAEQATYLDKLENASTHLLEVVESVLDLSRIEAGKLELNEGEFNLNELVSNVMAMFHDRARAKHLFLSARVANIPDQLIGDRIRLKQALINYLSNAVKFTQRGSIGLRVFTEHADSQTILVRFEVTDTGEGIAQDTLDRLFTPFEQADPSSTRQHGGSGLGLTITRQIARMMGGDAGVRSIEGSGSTFWFTARLGRPPAVQQALDLTPVAQAPAEIDQAPLPGAPHRILLVEDEPISREIVAMMLGNRGWVVDTARDGIEAVEMGCQVDYALILMDMQMPRLDGLSATRLMRKRRDAQSLPILAMTANAFADDRARCMEAGMNDFLSKPVQHAQLIATVEKWLQRPPPPRSRRPSPPLAA